MTPPSPPNHFSSSEERARGEEVELAVFGFKESKKTLAKSGWRKEKEREREPLKVWLVTFFNLRIHKSEDSS